MIKINKSDGEDGAEEHYKQCIHEVRNRINLSILFFEIILNSNKKIKKNKSFFNTFQVNSKSLNYFVKTYFPKKYRKKSKNQPQTRVSLFESLFFEGNSYMVKITISKARKNINFLKEVSKNIDILLKGTPTKLEKYLTSKSKEEQKQFKGLIEFIFSYEKLGNKKGQAYGVNKNWNSYALTKKLNINVCPYCNKNWINTVIDKDGNKVTNPQLDHFFPKDKYPLLRLSFYNLIPSCETCNSRIKGDIYLSTDNYIHPHIEGLDPEYYFAPEPENTNSTFGLENEYTISLKEDDSSDKYDKAKESFEFFHIKDVYEQHGDIISEIYFKKSKYNLTALKDLLSHEMFKGMSLYDAYRVVFANYLKSEDHNKRPFAKLTKDTLRHLEVEINEE